MRALFIISSLISVASAATPIQLDSDHVPFASLMTSRHIGRLAAETPLTLTVALNLKNQAELENLINRIYDPKDSMYGQFLTSAQFAENFGPTAADFAAVANYLAAHRLQVVRSSTNSIQFQGTSSDIETAFGLELHQYQALDGSIAYAPTTNPIVDSTVAAKIAGVLGLNSFSRFVAHRRLRDDNIVVPLASGTGPNNGLSPSDINTAYGFSGADGTGQTLALMELDGYTSTDISTYTKNFNFSKVPTLQNILVDNYNGSAGEGADEVTLDIELMMAVAPGASKIMVYEGPNLESGPIDVYAKIADDNIAKQVSTSWGSAESQNTQAFLNSENTIFMQMAAQGQTIYAAAGDSGAYDDGTNLSVDDPASQPYVVATGGTTLTLGSGSSYGSETSWGVIGQAQKEGAGGGISSIWPMPSFQAGVASATNQGSSTQRMVPDISIDANPKTGYAIYTGGAWQVFGGTSCAAPIWAAFTALVNQSRAAKSLAPIGFINPVIYKLAESSAYKTLFNDVADKSTNLFYAATTGYDLSTGWGSPKGAALLAALVGGSSTTTTNPTPMAPPAPTNLTIISITTN